MNTYLAIITTVLVITQIIRLAQNHIQLRRQNIIFKKQLGDLANMDVQKEDFEIQRKAYRLIVEKLEEGTSDKQRVNEAMWQCNHALSGKTNELGEVLLHCEITDSFENVSLGQCIGNCESQESEVKDE
jgi:hypothetical protein